jgi:uncharacterized protein involved in type VI secretion and phage assembly
MRVSRKSFSLAIVSILLAALTTTRSTEAQDASLSSPRPFFGLVLAVVVDVVDPQAAGRIKVRFPSLPDQTSVWARVSLPLGGNRSGLWVLPDVNDEVIVAFEHGDIHKPIVLGSLWNGNPPQNCGH